MVERLKSSRTNDPSPVCGSSTDRCASEQAPFLQGASPVSVPTAHTATKVVLDKQGKVCDKDDERCRTAQIGGQGDAVFSTILHYLAKRWGPQDRDRTLALRADIGTSALSWKHGRLTASHSAAKSALSVHVEQDTLMLLAMGYQTADDLQTQGKLKADKATLALLSQLFPLQTAHMSWQDRF